MTSKKNLVQITVAKRKVKKSWKVRYYGKNGEMLASSEILNSHKNAKKNIIAVLNLCTTGMDATTVTVLDLSGKSVRKYFLSSDGTEIEIED